MKTLGLIGGTSWISTVDYYRYINQLINERMGGVDAARLILYSVNFGELAKLVIANDWDAVARFLSTIAVKLENAGADCIVLCANTTHIAAETIQTNISIPILHIVDAVAAEIERQGIGKVGLLGTKFTMEKDFFKERMATFGIETIVPDEGGRQFVHDSIFQELGKDIFRDETRQRYLAIMDDLKNSGAGGVILGCTEIPMLIKQSDCDIPVFDTTFIHAKYAVDFALSAES